MRSRTASPFLLLLSPCLSYAASDNLSPSRTYTLHKRDAVEYLADAQKELGLAPERPVSRKATSTSRPYRGTDDAPVDGLDGKPHAGPFVDYSFDEDDAQRKSAVPTSLAKFASEGDGKWKLEDIPARNDGVMDDENRVAPKKGTTGTEGGISEKERLRKEGGSSTANRPQEPKEAPFVPEYYKQDDLSDKSSSTSSSRAYGYSGLERPNDLPDRPHDLPYPDRSGINSPRDADDPPFEYDESGSSGSRVGSSSLKSDGKGDSDSPRTWKDSTSSMPSKPSLLDMDTESWHEWFHSFVLSLTMILFSEIGDKTFLIAALMAMRHSQILVFSAAFSALVVMTILSAILGHTVPTLLPKRITTIAAAILFLVFGAKMLREGLAMPIDLGVGEEMREVEAELEEKEQELARDSRRRDSSSASPYSLEAGRGRQHHTINLPHGTGQPSPPASRSPSPPGRKSTVSGLMNLCSLVLSPAWVQTFVMTFLGEWGDRSQIATIAMAAGQDYWNVTLGALLGHACCTGVAVIGGRALAGKVSMRVVTIGGAVAFLAFGVIYLAETFWEA